MARGVAHQATADLRPTVHIYRSVGEQRTEAVGATVRAGDGLLIAYSNPSPDLAYLMCFAVDEAGRIHWYYPAYEKTGTDPVAIPIRTGAVGVELGEEVHHELAPGALRMFALFLPRPRHVLEVEAMVRQAWATHGGSVHDLGELPIDEASQVSKLLQVTP